MSDTDENVEEILEDVEYVRSEKDSDDGSEEEDEEEEEEESIYDTEDFISDASISEKCTLPYDILQFDFSFGYASRKLYNLTVIDENTVVFASGNYLSFLNIETKAIWFRRSALGGGIGHITTNPNPDYSHLAVAESGEIPLIIIYDWPSMEIDCVLRGGATKLYTYIDYSPDGDLLVSQAGEPDHLITVWKWTKHRILLRTKSYINDVYRVKFSPYVPGQLSSCGLSHIKFWKMATTFTGLKLQGELGRFGKTEYSDILGILPMPDEKVVSGCSWGNILVWEAGLIKLEVVRSLDRKCHDGPIVQFFYIDGELWTVSMDGHVKVWWYEKIDQFDPSDEENRLQVDPTYDFYNEGVKLMFIQKRFMYDAHDTWYMAQDANGGIWKIDLNTEEEPQKSEQIYKSNSGCVVQIQTHPYGPYLVTLGELGKLHLYNYIERKLLHEHIFPAKGSCLLWLPISIQNSGDEILASFDDGQIRVCLILISNLKIEFQVVQVIKPHSKPITTMSYNKSGTILVSAGEDSTIFIFELDKSSQKCTLLKPIGFIPSPANVTCLEWHFELKNVILCGCMEGHLMEVELPLVPQDYTEVSYRLQTEPRFNQFVSYKSQIRRFIKLEEIAKYKMKKVETKMVELEQIKRENPGLEIDEDIFLADSEDEEELAPLYYPEVPNKIIWLKYTDNETIWLSMAGYDAGYIYEYSMDQESGAPINFKMVEDADDVEINSYLYNHTNEYLIFAMQDGSVRVNRVNPEDFTDLTDYWILTVHDNINGFIPKMCFSFDEKYFFTCGHDGNIFSFKFQPDKMTTKFNRPASIRTAQVEPLHDVDGYEKLSLEQTKIKAEEDRIAKLAFNHKTMVREKVAVLKDRYLKVLEVSKCLLDSQKLLPEDMELDSRVTEYVDTQFQDKLDLVKRKMAYDVEKSALRMHKLNDYLIGPLDFFPVTIKGINSHNKIMTVKQRVVASQFVQIKKYVEEMLLEEELKGRPVERPQLAIPIPLAKPVRMAPLEYFLMSLSPSVIEFKLGPKLNRVLAKYRKRREKWEKRLEEWDLFIAKKPKPGVNHPQDEVELTDAKQTIGDYKLKSSDDYKISHEKRETTLKKYKTLLDIREKQFYLRHEFCAKIYEQRERKQRVLQFLNEQKAKLDRIHTELPLTLVKSAPFIPAPDDSEFPERNLEVNVIIPEDEEVLSEDFLDVAKERTYLEPPTEDELEFQLLPFKEDFLELDEDDYFQCPVDSNVIKSVADMTFEEQVKISENEDEDTPYEAELRTLRLNRKNYEQTQIINSMEAEIVDFNDTIKQLADDRLQILVDGNFVDLFILTLHQELKILKDCEDHENQLSEDVKLKMNDMMNMQDIISTLQSNMSNRNKQLEEYHAEEKRIQEKFNQSTQDNKFYDFLKKVYRKKFKPPKVHIEGESSSEESSSSSSSDEDDDNDAQSIDSRDFGVIKQDINVCPKGCEQALFDLTITLRTQRHQIEQSVRESMKLLETVKKEFEINSKKMILLQNLLKTSQNDLEIFQRQKQKQLNQVRCAVVLKLDQIQYFDDETNIVTDVNDILVFSKSTLANLYRRVGLLQNETLQQKNKHEIYVKHIMRMKKDIEYMQRKIVTLKNQIATKMIEKFGNVIDVNEVEMQILQRKFKKSKLNDLEEVVIKKLVFDLRLKIVDIEKLFHEEVVLWGKKVMFTQKELANTYRENTRRLEILSVIKKEKYELEHLLAGEPKRKEQFKRIEATHSNNMKSLQKLQIIIDEQDHHINELKDEIQKLKTKGFTVAPKAEGTLQKIKEESVGDEEEEKDIWIEYDHYVDQLQDQHRQEMAIAKELKEIKLPEFFGSEVQDLVEELIKQMLSDLETDLTQRSNEEMVKNILSNIMHCASIADIVKEIVDNLPIEPSEEQISIVEDVAERIFLLQEPEITEDDVETCAKELLSDILDEVLLTVGEPHDVIANLVEMLVDHIPVDYLEKAESIHYIVQRLLESALNSELDRECLVRRISSSNCTKINEVKSILNLVLEQVYGQGMDYLFYIKK